MADFEIITELESGRAIWERLVPPVSLTDLWEVRECFQSCYQRPAAFIVGREGGEVIGLLPLSWIEEAGIWGYFPGETWRGRTWLEQNRIPVRDAQTLAELVSRVPGACQLRYLLPHSGSRTVDETGYYFSFSGYDWNYHNYLAEFSSKSRRRLRRELESFHDLGLAYQHNQLEDLNLIAEMNIARFGENSYFSDPRFRQSFERLARLLAERGWLRLTLLLVGGEPAACDLGAVYRGVYTLLAGGTAARFPGVAKVINLHHIEWSCAERLELVDFLCGDFTWKPLFHLTPRPLYLLTSPPAG